MSESRPSHTLREQRVVLAAAIGVALLPGASRAQEPAPSALEEIVVTARFREENLQTAPLAVSAFTAETLESLGIGDVQSLGAVIPNAYFRPKGGTPIIGLRGKINGETLSFDKPTVAVYTDDVYWARQTGINFNLLDIERVEVLRGPQGTLFGKNALGGAVRIVTQAPRGDGTGYLEATYGEFDEVGVKGALDIALTEKVFARLTGFSEERDGYIDKLDFACQMFQNGTPELAGYGDGIVGVQQVGSLSFAPAGRDNVPLYAPVFGTPGSAEDNAFAYPRLVDNDMTTRVSGSEACKIGTFRGTDIQGARAQLRWQPSENLDITFSVDRVDDNSEAWANVMRKGDSVPADFLQVAFVENYIMPHAGIGLDKIVGDPTSLTDGAFYRDPQSYSTFENWLDLIDGENLDAGEQIENSGFSMRIAWDINDALTFTYIGAYRELDTSLTASAGLPGEGWPYDFHNQVIWQHHEQRQNELRLEGTAFGDRLEWTVGGFWFQTDEWELLKTDVSWLEWAGLFELRHNDQFASDNKSLFGHAVFRFTPKLALTAGVRYTDEVNDILFNHPPNLVAQDVLRATADRSDWKIGLDYQIDDQYFVYGLASTGFRSRGFQGRPFTPAQINDVYLPYPQEEVLSYEVGFKGDFFGQRLRVNLAAFVDDYDPRVVGSIRTQCSAFDSPEPPYPYQGFELIDGNGDGIGEICPPSTTMAGTTGFIYPFNISTPAEVKGYELEAVANPVGNLLLTFSYGSNEFSSKIDDPSDPGFIHPDARIQPEKSMSAGIQYEVSLQSGGTLTPRLDWSYQDETSVGVGLTASLNSGPTPDQIVPSYSLLNARLTYQAPDSDWEAALSVQNLTDKFYWYTFEAGTGFGVLGSPGVPRTWAMSLRRSF
jgi:iron complex outermembrane recepter protein